MIYIILTFSFLFETMFTNIITIDSFLIPLFLLTSLSILYPYFKKNKLTFFIASVICGFFYDIMVTNSPFINTISFGICSAFIILGYNYMNYNIVNSNFINVIIIIIYRVVSYLLLFIIDFIKFNENNLLQGIYNSILVNIIYGVILYIVIDLTSKIFNIKRVE